MIIRPASILAALAGTILTANHAVADIDPVGDVTPGYDGFSDPWDISQLIVGETGFGMLTVDAGSVVQSDFGIVGQEVGSDGIVELLGIGTLWESGFLTVGSFGSGTVNVLNGAHLITPGAVFGANAGSSGSMTVSGSNSRFVNTQIMAIGQEGNGTLNLQLSGVAQANLVSLGITPGSSGSVIATSNSRFDVNERIAVGGSVFGASGGTGFLEIIDGASGSVGDGPIDLANGLFTISDTSADALTTRGLTVYSGGTVVIGGRSVIGTAPDTYGSALVTGQSATWETRGSLIIGENGTGDLLTENGGLTVSGLTQSTAPGLILGEGVGSTGTARVTGSESLLRSLNDIVVGGAGAGTLRVENGGSVTAGTIGLPAQLMDFDLTLGELQGSSGLVQLSGLETSIRSFATVVGKGGAGTLLIDDGAFATSFEVELASESSSSAFARVDGMNSVWEVIGGMQVGVSGDAVLGVGNGGVLRDRSLSQIGLNVGSSGLVTVSGEGSEWNNNDLEVGLDGTGTLRIFGGGSVITSDTAVVGAFSNGNGSGEVSVAGPGSFWQMDQLRVGTASQGEVAVVSGASMLTQASAILEGSPFGSGSVTITGNGSRWDVEGDLLNGTSFEGIVRVEDGAYVEIDGFTVLGGNGIDGDSSNGRLTVTDTDSEFFTSGIISDRTGIIEVLNGGQLTTGTAEFFSRDITGESRVSGAGSTWTVQDNMTLDGVLTISNGGMLDNRQRTEIGLNRDSQLTVTGDEAYWKSEGLVNIGVSGDGDVLVSGGATALFRVGTHLGLSNSGTLHVSGADTFVDARTNLIVGDTDFGDVVVDLGGLLRSEDTTFGNTPTGLGIATVSGDIAEWVVDGSLDVGLQGGGELNVVDESRMVVVGQTTLATEEGSNGDVNVRNGSGLELVDNLIVGVRGTATLEVTGNSSLSSFNAELAAFDGSSGLVIVNGQGSSMSHQQLAIGLGGYGVMQIDNGASVDSGSASIGGITAASGLGTMRVWNGSRWDVGSLNLNAGGSSELDIASGGLVDVDGSARLGIGQGGAAEVTISDNASEFRVLDDLDIGVQGAASLDINTGGYASVGGTTTISDLGAVNLLGGRFEFGNMSIEDYGRINGVSGSLAGDLGQIELTGFNHISDVELPISTGNIAEAVDTSEVTGTLSNSGDLFGNGSTRFSITNNPDGRIEVITSERMRFAGDGTNNGMFSVFGGLLRFEGDVINNSQITMDNGQFLIDGLFTNAPAGVMTGHGLVDFGDGSKNQGAMRFSGGITDIYGDFNNEEGASILTTGGGATTFYGNVVHNGEIETAEAAFTVFIGDFSGAGSFPGDGRVQFEGAFDPGNSPAVIDFGGDLVLTRTAITTIEIADTAIGEFDAFRVGGDFDIDGTFQLELIDQFQLGLNQSFLIADVAGETTGQFLGLAEGDVVGTYGGIDLFITYSAGDGHDVVLYSVPTPGSALLLGLGIGTMGMRRRRWTGTSID